MNLNLGDTQLIIDECKKQGLLRNEAAYVLATTYHETAHTMKPVREYGGEKYLKSKKYYPYVGMGYVQLTWKENYEKAGKYLSVDFVKNPKLLLEAKYAAPILVIGMKEGWFTGKKLSDYITLQKSDFAGARRIVNGTDRASLIAGYAKEYDKLLKTAGYGEASHDDKDHVCEEHPLKSKRTWFWSTVLTGTPIAAFAALHWSAQLLLVGGIMGLAVYSIITIPAVKRHIAALFE